MNLSEKKNLLEKIVFESKYNNNALIYQLLIQGKLDDLILKLDTKKTWCNSNSIVKKGYLTSEEQFISIVNGFLSHIKTIFKIIEIEYIPIIASEGFKSEYNEIFLSKDYFGDNQYIEKYTMMFDKILVSIFLKNLWYLNLKGNIDEFPFQQEMLNEMKKKMIGDKTITEIVENPNDVEDILFWLNDILLCNLNHQYRFVHLFLDIEEHVVAKEKELKEQVLNQPGIKNGLLKPYFYQWDYLYHNYQEKKQYISLLK